MRAQANGIELEYDAFGDPADPTVLLVMGLGMQMIAWDPGFCELIAGRGFHVVRFDNRDVGLSTQIRDAPKPNVLPAMLGAKPRAAYGLTDMAADAVGLLDHLDVAAAHVVGASMGAMIAQEMAIEHPERVLSLCSIMAGTGDRRHSRPRMKALGLLLKRTPRERDAYVDYSVEVDRVIGSPGFPLDEEAVRDRAARSFARGHHPAGVARQLLAVLAARNRTERMARVGAPTVVIHGKEDPLSPIGGGRATARAIPDARLVEIDGMGHSLPRDLWPRIVDEIVANTERAGVAAGGRV